MIASRPFSYNPIFQQIKITTMKNVTINIKDVFAKFENVNELKAIAQSVVNQVNAAYQERMAELLNESDEKQPIEIAVDASAKGKKTAKAAAKGAKNATPAKAEKTTAKSATEKTAKTAEKKAKEAVEQVSFSSLTKAQIKAMGLKFEKYSEKCMFLTGNTRSIKDAIMAMGGAHWNGHRQGWFIKNESAKEIAKALKIKIA